MFGDDSTTMAGLGLDVLADLNSIVQSAKDFVVNAATGKMSDAQKTAIDLSTRAAIVRAAAGNKQLADQALAQWAAELAAALQDTGTEPAPTGSFDLGETLRKNWPWLVLAGGAAVFAAKAL